jgi:hypothetical protein
MFSGTVKLRRGLTLAAGEVQPMGHIENGGPAEKEREEILWVGFTLPRDRTPYRRDRLR